jgi:hypothetical protein
MLCRSTYKLMTPHFRGHFHRQIFSANADANIEGAAIRSPAIFTVAIIRRAELPGVTQLDSAA